MSQFDNFSQIQYLRTTLNSAAIFNITQLNLANYIPHNVNGKRNPFQGVICKACTQADTQPPPAACHSLCSIMEHIFSCNKTNSLVSLVALALEVLISPFGGQTAFGPFLIPLKQLCCCRQMNAGAL